MVVLMLVLHSSQISALFFSDLDRIQSHSQQTLRKHFSMSTDRDSRCFLWLSNPTNKSSPFVTYRFRDVLFGASSSPFMLYAALSFHLTQNSSVVSQDLLHNLYVGNIVSVCPCEETVLSYFTDSLSQLSSAGFNLHSWFSNCGQLQHVRT